jgi:hypothetical protein
MFRRWSAIAAIVILTIVAIIKWQSTLLPTNTYVPITPQASPNARTYFDRACDLVPKTLGAATYDSGTAPGVTKQELNDPNSGFYSPPISVRDRLVEQAQPSFRILEEGLKYQYTPIPSRSYTVVGHYMQLAMYRNLARSLYAASLSCIAHKDWQGAAHYDLVSFDLGVHLTHNSDVLGDEVGIAAQSIGRRPLMRIFGHLSAQQCLDAAAKMQEEGDQQPPLTDTLTQEKWATQGALLDLFRHKGWRQQLVNVSSGYDYYGSEDGRPHLTFWSKIESPRTAYETYTSFMDRAIADSSLPWQRRPHLADQDDAISRVTEPDYLQLLFHLDVSNCLTRLAVTQLALRAYALQHDRYPATLQELQPKYLSSLPTDPFSEGQIFKYKWLSPSQYVLYSVGPDSKDDGGLPITDVYLAVPPIKPMYMVDDPTSKGDIVAGTNY